MSDDLSGDMLAPSWPNLVLVGVGVVEVGKMWVEIFRTFECKVNGIRLIFKWSVKLLSYEITFFYPI